MPAARAKRFSFNVEPLRLLPLVLGSLFVVMAAVDALITFQPTVLVPLRESFLAWVGAGWVPPSFASLFATGVAVAGIAIAATLLSAFVRGVAAAPFVWLAPLVVGSGAAVMAGSHVTLPLPLNSQWFAGLCALFLLGGGVMLQPRSLALRCAGALVMATPALLLVIAYAQAPAALSSAGVMPFGGVLLLVSAASAALAVATGPARTLDGDELGEQLMELVERAKAGEARALFAERQLAQAMQGADVGTSADEFALLRRSGPGVRVLWAALFFVLSAATTAYFVGYAPLQQRASAQQKQLAHQEQQHAKAVASLQARFDDERRGFEQALQSEKTRQAEAQTALAATNAAVSDTALAKPAQASAIATVELPVTKRAEAPVAKPAQAPDAKPTETAPSERMQPAQAGASPARAAVPSHKPQVVSRVAPAARSKKTHAPAHAAKAAASDKPAAAAQPARDDDDRINDDPIGGL